MTRTGFEAARRKRLERHYDGLGAGQDREAWYADPAFDALGAIGRFADAGAVAEVGCGTGRLAQRLLGHHLGPQATYFGIDVSAVMVGLTRARLAAFGGRCRVERRDGRHGLPLGDGAADRVVIAFVLDLLTPGETRALLDEVRRVLAPGGLLCASSLDRGIGLVPRLRALAWRLVHRAAPLKVGGCRPLDLAETLGRGWSIECHVRRNIKNCAIASIAASPLPHPAIREK